TPGVVDARVVPTRVVPTRRLLARRAARSERAETEVELDIVFVVPGHHHGDDVDRLERVGRTGVVPAFRVELRPREEAARAPDLDAPAVILVLPAELVLELDPEDRPRVVRELDVEAFPRRSDDRG